MDPATSRWGIAAGRRRGPRSVTGPTLVATVGLVLGLAACDTGPGATQPCGPTAPTQVAAPTGPLGNQVTGQPLPDITVFTLDGCEPVSSGTWVGTPLVVNFWASWCGPCRAEMPELDAASRALEGQVTFVGVTFQDRPDDSRAFLEEVPVGYDTFIDAGGEELFRASQARGTPSTLLVDEDGVIVHRHAGPISSQALRDAIRDHLGVDLESTDDG